MAKKLFKSISVGIMVFAIALLSGYIAYVIAYNNISEKEGKRINDDAFAEAMTTLRNTAPGQVDGVDIDYYLARFENNDISVYMVSGGEEVFMYSLNIRAAGLPAEDVIRLKKGIMIDGKEELVAFEEDYTS